MSSRRDADPAIVASGVSKRFGRNVVLDSVDLTVARGEFCVLVGPSGSGKSTLLNLLAVLETPDRGDITVAGRRVGSHHARHLSRYRRFDVGIVFQLHNLIPRLTARENVEAAMFGTHHSRRQRRERADELLDRLQLHDRAGDRPPTMSGGERQRVAVARALANDPAVVLADEPTGSLDDASAAILIGLFDEIISEGTTILAVSHDPRFNSHADRLVRLADGRLSEVERHPSP